MAAQSASEPHAMKRFRLNTGRYVQDHPTEKLREGGVTWPAEQIFVQGQVIETAEDLERFNSPGAGGPKFTKLDDPAEAETIESLEAKLAEMRRRQGADSFDRTDEQQKTVDDAVKKGFDSHDKPAVIPNMPSPNPGNKVPEPVSSQEPSKGTKVSLARLHSMSVKQLQDLAAEEEIDVKGATQKDALIRILTRG